MAIWQRKSIGMSGEAEPLLAERLKLATREIHEQVETGVEFTRLIVTALPTAAADAAMLERARQQYMRVYEAYLVSAYGFETAVISRVEQSGLLESAQATGYELGDPDVSERILSDLAALPERRLPVALMRDLPELDDLPALAGMEYVRRGSRKGNAVIARSVKQNLGFDAEQAARYLNMHGQQTNPRFQAFRDWLDGLGLSAAEAQRAVKTALATFRAVGVWHQDVEAWAKA